MIAPSTPLEILYRVGRELVSSLDLHMVLSRVLAMTTESIGVKRASLVVLDESGKPLDAAIMFDGTMIPSTLTQLEDILTFGLAGWVMRHHKAVRLPDTHQDARWLAKPIGGKAGDEPKSAVCVPLMARDQLVGMLTVVHPKVNYFSDDLYTMLLAIADMAGIAVHNARLYSEAGSLRSRYQDLFEGSIDPILITGLDGRILESNHKALQVTGLSAGELNGVSISTLHQPATQELNASIFQPGSSEPVSYNSTLRLKDQSLLPVEVHVAHVLLQGKELIQWVFRDLSEKVRLDKMREDLTAMIYHDLRSPLANIISSLEIMQDTLPKEQQSKQMKQLFDIADRSTTHMQRLISSLLDIDRLEAGQGITKRSRVQVEGLINDSIATVAPLALNKEISIEKLIPLSIPPLYIDEDMIRRVLINLVENACKFSPQRGKVSVGAKLNGEMVMLWVDDQGPGIPEDAHERIFEKFARLDGKSPVKGLGLGLNFLPHRHPGSWW